MRIPFGLIKPSSPALHSNISRPRLLGRLGLISVVFVGFSTAISRMSVKPTSTGTTTNEDASLFKKFRTLGGHTRSVNSVVYSPDNHTLASSSEDRKVIIWDVRNGKSLRTIAEFSDGVEISFLPDGKTLATADNVLSLWNVKTGRKEKKLFGFVDSSGFAFYGKMVATQKNGIAQLYSLNTGKLMRTLPSPKSRAGVAMKGSIFELKFSPNGKFVAGKSYNTVHVWETKSGKLKRVMTAQRDALESIAFYKDNDNLAGVCSDGTTQIWDVRSGKLKSLVAKHTPIYKAAFSLDGKRVALGYFKNVKPRLGVSGMSSVVDVIDVKTGQLVGRSLKVNSLFSSLAISSHGKFLAVGMHDGTVILWNVKPS